jgi:hypothetical protein
VGDYPSFHQDHRNLLIHIVAVPLFDLTAMAALFSLSTSRWLSAALFALGPVASLAAQAYGHGREPDPPRPFRGPLDFVRRILTEQFAVFPLFVFTGGWARALRRPGP